MQTKLTGIKERIILHRLLGASVGALAVFVLGFVLAPTLASEAHAAENVSASVSWDPISLSLDPHGDIDFGEVIPSSRDTTVGNYGTQKVVKKAIDVTTNGDYYAVYLSTIDNDNSLSTSYDAVQAIPAISTSSTFSSTSWGFAVPTTETLPTLSAYDSYLVSSSDATANNLTKLGTGASVYNTGLWSGVPVLDDVSQIYHNQTNVINGFSSGDSFNIYYSIMVDTDTMAGTYENQVVYTAIAQASRGDISYNVARDKDIATSYAGETETLQIDLATSSTNGSGGSDSTPTLTANDIEIRLVPHSIILSNNYNVASLTKTDYPNCPVSSVSNITNSQSVEIVCNLPRFGAKGSTDTNSTYAVANNSAYDFWVNVTLPDNSTIDYVSHYKENASDVASLTYKTGLQSIDTASARLVTHMQQVTPSICANTFNFDNTKVSTTNFVLDDSREGVYYDIRKIDDKCWMASNLRFSSTNLNPSTTDVNVAKTITYGDSTSGGSYDQPRMHLGNDYDGNPNAWYNFVMASAGTHVGQNNTAKAEYSICPKNWRLPTRNELQSIVNNSKRSDAKMDVGGTFYDDTGTRQMDSFWFSSEIDPTLPSYAITLKYNYDYVTSFYSRTKSQSFYIRCIARD